MIKKKKRKGWEIRKGDIYSIGVIAFVLLTGLYPFHGPNKELIKKAILNGKLRWPKHVKLSENCKDFILSLLSQNVKKRPTAKEALSHKWLADASTDDLGDDLKIYQTNFHHSNKLQQILIQAIFSEMSTDEKKFVVEELKKYKKDRMPLNNECDITRQTSLVSEQEFVEFLIANHVEEKKAASDSQKLFKQISFHNDVKSQKDVLNVDVVLSLMDKSTNKSVYSPSFVSDDVMDEVDHILSALSPTPRPKVRKSDLLKKTKVKSMNSLMDIDEQKEQIVKTRSQSMRTLPIKPSIMITNSNNKTLSIEIYQKSPHSPGTASNGSTPRDWCGGDEDKDVLESVHGLKMEDQDSLFRTEVNLHEEKLTITVQQFKDLLSKAPVKINIDSVINDLDPKGTGIIDLKQITDYSREIEMCD